MACLGRPGGDRLSRGLSRSIIGAGGFHGRVRDGIGWFLPRHGHQVVSAKPVCGSGENGVWSGCDVWWCVCVCGVWLITVHGVC